MQQFFQEKMNLFLNGNTQEIRMATKDLKQKSKIKQSLPILFSLLQNHPNQSIRQLSTILLKKSINYNFSNLNKQQQQFIKNSLLQRFQKQQNHAVKKGISILIGILVPKISLDKWPQLDIIFKNNIQSKQKHSFFLLLNNLLPYFDPSLNIIDGVLGCLNDKQVDQLAWECILTYVQNHHQTSFNMGNFLIKNPPKNEQMLMPFLQILTCLSESRSSFSAEHLQWVLENIIENKNLPNRIRQLGLDLLNSVSIYNKKILKKEIRKIVLKVINVAQEKKPKDFQQNDQQEIWEVALWLLQTFTVNIQQKIIFPIFFEIIENKYKSLKQEDQQFALMILSSISQGCASKMRRHLNNPIMSNFIPKGLSSQNSQIRQSAIKCITYFSQFLRPEILSYHNKVIPALCFATDDKDQEVRDRALAAIDVFIQQMSEQQISIYLEKLIPTLIKIVQEGSNKSKKISLSAIGSCISASQLQFYPYLQISHNIILKILQLPCKGQNLSLISESLLTMGTIISVFCSQKSPYKQQVFNYYIKPKQQSVFYILMNQTDQQILEGCICFYYNLIQIYQFDKFQQVILKVLNKATEDGLVKTEGFSLQQEDQMMPGSQIQANLSFLDLKSAAIYALGKFAQYSPFKFKPYIDKTMNILKESQTYFYQDVRCQVCQCYTSILFSLVKFQNNGEFIKYKQGVPITDKYGQVIQDYLEKVWLIKIRMYMADDTCPQVQSTGILCFEKALKKLGPSICQKYLEHITILLMNLLEASQQIQTCQQIQNEMDEEQNECNVQIFQSITQLIPTLSKCFRTGFLLSLIKLFPTMMSFLSPEKDINDNIQMVGCFSEVYKHVPQFIQHSHAELIPKLCQIIEINDEQLARNIVYCFGNLVLGAPQLMNNYLDKFFFILNEVYQKSILLSTKENVLSTFCRIFYTINPPLKDNIISSFVQQLFNLLPFKGSIQLLVDFKEQRQALKGIMFLAQKCGWSLKGKIEKMKEIFLQSINNHKKYKIKQPLFSEVSNFITKLQTL